MFTFFLIVQTIVAASLVIVILMQRSEGGGLGVGSSSSGLMTARGAADFLTRATTILATLFVGFSIVLAGLAAVNRVSSGVDPSLVAPAAPAAPASGQVPLAAGAIPGIVQTNAAIPAQAQTPAKTPAQTPAKGSVPLAQ
jgi:preprotein translocase subunit SecG